MCERDTAVDFYKKGTLKKLIKADPPQLWI